MNDITEFLNSLPVPARKPRKPKPVTTEQSKLRYQQAHELDFAKNYPTAYADGHYFKPKMPDCRTANGLTQAIVKFILWNGYRATRIASSGRIVKSPERQASGTILQTAKYIPGSTRKGTADISATIKGKSVMIEIKVGNDRPSPEQLREQELERNAGGCYEFIGTFEEFLVLYDGIVLLT